MNVMLESFNTVYLQFIVALRLMGTKRRCSLIIVAFKPAVGIEAGMALSV